MQSTLADGAREERRALAGKSGHRVAAAGRLAEAAIPARVGAARARRRRRRLGRRVLAAGAREAGQADAEGRAAGGGHALAAVLARVRLARVWNGRKGRGR